MKMKNFREAYPATDGWSLTSEVSEVSGLIYVTVTLRKDGSPVLSVPAEAAEKLEKAYMTARDMVIESLGVCEADDKPSPRPTSAPEAKPKKERAPEHEFPDPDPPIPEPKGIEPLAKESSAKPKPKAVPSRAPGEHAGDKKPDAGLISVLKDVCEAEGIDYREPETAEQATDWIFAIQQDGARELTDDLKPSQAQSETTGEEEEEVANAS